MAEAYKLYKLIVLYMLDKIDFPLTNSQISEFILNEGYTNYFTLQQTLSELSASGFIHEESTHSRTFYHLTEDGRQTLHFFKNDISPAIQDDINEFLTQKKYELKNEVSVKSVYYQNSGGDFSVRCQVFEQGSPLIDLTLTAPTEAEAQTMSNNWAKKNQEIYASIMTSLL